MRKPGLSRTWTRTLPVTGQPVAVDRKDRPGWQRCEACALDWPTSNPIDWRCPMCGGATVYRPKEG